MLCLLLQTWLDEFLDVDCSNEVFEVGCSSAPEINIGPGSCVFKLLSITHCFLPCDAAPLAVDFSSKHGLCALQVQEDFSYGFIEQLNRTRAAEKVRRPHTMASPVLSICIPCRRRPHLDP